MSAARVPGPMATLEMLQTVAETRAGRKSLREQRKVIQELCDLQASNLADAKALLARYDLAIGDGLQA